MSLHEQKCQACVKGTLPLKEEALQKLSKQIHPEWLVKDGHHLFREFKFKDFKEALAFTNKVGELAEKENHHPDILLAWGKVEITLFTHKIKGLSEADFILAAKCDLL